LKKVIKAATLGLIILSSATYAQVAQAAQKVGYVSTAQIFQALPQREAVAKKLQEEFKDKAAELQALEASIKTKMEQARRDGELLGEAGLRDLKNEIVDLENAYKLKGQSLERAGKQREAEEQQKLFKLIQEAISTVAEAEGYDMIIDAQALQFAKPDLNLSQKVIDELK
jgi:outer membrane protein